LESFNYYSIKEQLEAKENANKVMAPTVRACRVLGQRSHKQNFPPTHYLTHWRAANSQA
jgi:hypothetical protein